MVRRAHPEWKIFVWMAYAGWCIYVLLTVFTENIMPVMSFSR